MFFGNINVSDQIIKGRKADVEAYAAEHGATINGLVNSLQECYDMVRNNRAELDIPDQSPRGLEAEYCVEEELEYYDDEY